MEILTGGIGFFDSGIGGLGVLKTCLPHLNGFPVYYYGDNARAPYGNLPENEICTYAEEAFDVFDRLKVRAAVIACNTVTSVCAERFRKKYPFPIVGAEPAVLPAARAGGEIFVLSTKMTAEGERLQCLCARAREINPSVKLRIFPCERLAGALEEAAKGKMTDFSSFLPQGNPDGVVLGCTHYVFIKSLVEKFYACPVYDGNEGISRVLNKILRANNSFSGGKMPADTIEFPALFTDKNICSQLSSQNENFLLYFIGSGKETNIKIYERMFVCG